MAYVQMEALSAGLPSKDDWDFVFNGYSNAPFIKTNYPHPSGVWSWDNEADQVALVLQYIRRSMVEYGDVMWYHSFKDSYNKDRVKVEELYGKRNDIDGEKYYDQLSKPFHANIYFLVHFTIIDFYGWRDANVLLEIYKYGWYIDYWMENGAYRDRESYESHPSITDHTLLTCISSL
jgi:hypothetical protein